MNKHQRYLTILFLCTILACNAKTNRNSNNDATRTDFINNTDESIPDPVKSDSIKKYSQLLKEFFVLVDPVDPAGEWYLPFELPDRSNLNNITFISGYGAYRSTRLKGHLHSGIDIVPANKKSKLDVFAISKGVVCFINQEAPFKTVIIKHKMKDGTIIYSSYIHLKQIFTERGKTVDELSKIGVLYTKSEAHKYGGNFDHLHLEIKKKIDDFSCASWLCMNKEELDNYFINPTCFLKTNLKP
jgi:murein DD-endopeptidase MepM/ murein hydrolase activator NlpD